LRKEFPGEVASERGVYGGAVDGHYKKGTQFEQLVFRRPTRGGGQGVPRARGDEQRVPERRKEGPAA